MKQTSKNTFIIIVTLIITILSAVIAIGIGSVTVPIPEILQVIFATPTVDKFETIVLDIRLPRVLLTLIIGANIAISGAFLQKAPLLDESTTYLDIAHQHEVLELVRELNNEMKMTIVMVLHDLNQAARYSDRILVIQQCKIIICGTTNEVMTEHMIRDVYHMDAEVEFKNLEEKPRIHLICTCKDLLQKDRRDICEKNNRCSKI